MRVAIVSDIHGNRQAFEAVLDAIDASDCDELWCLGDLVGYGADPDACVELTREHAVICLAGNHDMGVRGDLPLEDFSRGAALAARWTQKTITSETLTYLKALDPVNLDEQVGLYHASPRDPG
jgi:predicted phosphodiesterase